MSGMNVPLPFEIQEEILKRVPEVKSLLRFRSVSKPWKSLIDSPQFVADYRPHPRRHHIFVWYYSRIWNNYVSVIDNDDEDSDSFAQHKLPLSIPNSVDSLDGFEVYGSSQGLFCLYNNSPKGIAVLWNPSIQKSVTIDVPNVSYETVIGFGVSPDSSDPKLVRIQSFVSVSDDLKPRRVKLFSLSTGEWRTLLEDLPRSSVAFCEHRHVAIGNFIFWLAYEIPMVMKREMIILFDMISDKFMEIYLPDYVVTENGAYNELSLFKMQESLAVVASSFNYSVNRRVYHVWMMEGGVSDSFTKMYSIIRPYAADYSILAFRNNGHPILRMDVGVFDKLLVYEPDSEKFTSIWPSRIRYTMYAASYTETLLLLNH